MWGWKLQGGFNGSKERVKPRREKITWLERNKVVYIEKEQKSTRVIGNE